ncbi:zinc-dependent metalloprotease [Georgenia sp. Z1344]|uniref:zinc-dependent metalloprotease n=1 Tax=Georgenia sp. Z1344 TaxID=3416706 RepID=UPI003CE9CCE8
MSQDPAPREPEDGDADRSSWEEMLSSMLGPEAAAQAVQAMRSAGMDPAAMGQAAGLPGDAASLGPLIAQVQAMMRPDGSGPVNWRLATDLARRTATAEGDPAVTSAEADAVRAALRAADLWLDVATELPPAGGPREALTRAAWVERTLPMFRSLAEPVAASMSHALAGAIGKQLEDAPEEIKAFGAQLGDESGLLGQIGQAVYGMQLGQAVGTLAREVVGTTDISIPLLADPGAALVPANVAAFAEGLEIPLDEVRHFLAVRELAHARVFAHSPWLRAGVVDAVTAYARAITIDTSKIEDAVRSVDPTDPDALRGAMSGGVFDQDDTPEQEAALGRLATLLALVEGWVEEVTARAVAPHLPHGVQLREMLRRRRAAGGPAEQTFSTLVGLDLRPRSLREAARLWELYGAERGQEARDELWSHPDVLPTAEELADPEGFAAGREKAAEETSDVDSFLAELFAEDGDGQAGGDAGDGAGDGAASDDASDEDAGSSETGDGSGEGDSRTDGSGGDGSDDEAPPGG